MGIKLKSDFTDFYDAWFDSGECSENDIIFRRCRSSEYSRGQVFKYLKSIGCKVVRHGSCEEMGLTSKQLVVYTEPRKHNGGGKVLMDASEAMLSLPNYLCSEYHGDRVGYSIRYLQLGEFWFKIEFISKDDWRSNCGSNTEMRVIDSGYGMHKIIKEPIFAVDFVQTKNGLYATDFNIAPKADISYLGDMVRPMDIANSIKKVIKVREK